MGSFVSEITNKYQGVAPNAVVRAIKTAATKTGADFSFLMQKAAQESSFNPSAKAKSSSATGLFQFIESTWLSMVKEHGAKYGLGQYAKQIEMKDGKPCVANCDVRNAILSLRKNPEVSALMAGEFSAANREYLEKCTDCDVGATELYMAHFMGAGSAAKFLNARAENGDLSAAHLFPKEARANKSIFFNRAENRPRTLDEVYSLFAKKFSGDVAAPRLASSDLAPVQPPHTPTPPAVAQAPSGFTAADVSDYIIWDDNGKNTPIRRMASVDMSGLQKLSMENVLLMAQMNAGGYNS